MGRGFPGTRTGVAVAGVVVGVVMVLASVLLAVPLRAGSPSSASNGAPGAFVDPEFPPAILTSADPSSYGWFGHAVAVSGSTYVVGAVDEGDDAGAAYVENESTGTVVALAHPTDSGAEFGESVAIGSDRIVVGAPYGGSLSTGLVYVYNASTGSLEATYASPYAQPSFAGYSGLFGYSVATSGNWIVVGAPYENASGTAFAGHAYIINAVSGQIRMIESPEPQSEGQFGLSVSVSGNFVLVGAPGEEPAGTSYLEGGNAYLFSAATGDLITTYTSPTPNTYDLFGESVAIDGPGNVAVVGSPYCCAEGGAGAVFEISLVSGTMQTLVSPAPSSDGAFGTSVAAGKGVIAVGAPEEPSNGAAAAGNVYLFSESNASVVISELAPPGTPKDAQMGVAVAVNGSAVIVGAPFENASGLAGAGLAYIYTQIPLQVSSPNSIDYGEFGESVAVNGVVALGAPDERVGDLADAGHAYILTGSAGPIQSLMSPNAQADGYFGWSIAIGAGGTFVGAPRETVGESDTAGRVYEFNSSTDSLEQTFTAPEAPSSGQFGTAVAVSGDLLVVGAPGFEDEGAAYVFSASTGTLLQTLTDPNGGSGAEFGYSVAISSGTVAVGAPYDGPGSPGVVYLFNATEGTPIASDANPNAVGGEFGLSVALGSGILVVGAPENSFGSTIDAGNVYLFSATSGALLQNLSSPNPVAYGYFGRSVADNGGRIVIGAPGEAAFGVALAGNLYILSAKGGAVTDRYNSPVLAQAHSFSFGLTVAIGPGGRIASSASGYSSEGPYPGLLYLFFL